MGYADAKAKVAEFDKNLCPQCYRYFTLDTKGAWVFKKRVCRHCGKVVK